MSLEAAVVVTVNKETKKRMKKQTRRIIFQPKTKINDNKLSKYERKKKRKSSKWIDVEKDAHRNQCEQMDRIFVQYLAI